MDKKLMFLKTSDEITKQSLIKSGFQLIDDNNGIATFLNNSKISFDNTNKKVTYSNMLTI